MSLSIFDLFKVGIGPSSSHTVGPMWAAHRFLLDLETEGVLDQVERLQVGLYGSLALTGKGHATDIAVLLGLSGEKPDEIDPDRVDGLIEEIRGSGQLQLFGRRPIAFTEKEDLIFHFLDSLPKHPNGMLFTAFDAVGNELLSGIFYSVGGGFVLSDEEVDQPAGDERSNVQQPYPFDSADELLRIGEETGLSISDIVMANEKASRGAEEINEGLRKIWTVMNGCIERGCSEEGYLPGGLNVKRRAACMKRDLCDRPEMGLQDPLTVMDWVNLFALAVNEENAAGGRVVTAPTNGAAGVIPAVVAYYDRFVPGSNEKGIFTMLSTAAAIGMLYKKNASISAAEVGCQGEVGVACSMAAGGLAAAMGGTNQQIENAAEIGMEHNLGLTCDPIGGLVQVPCIERNTMGAIKAINAARLALKGDGTHKVSLDKVIETMRQTGMDMQAKYKETSQGGLAVNVVNC
ncbi:MAG: L-serine ammonia-lyase [Pseudomonadota bacterium]